MTPKPESETDPWAAVDRQMEILAAWSRTPPATFDELAQPIIGLVVAVNAARAAVERQHAEALAEKAAQIADLERGIRSLHETADGRAAALRDEVQARAKAEAENATLRAPGREVRTV